MVKKSKDQNRRLPIVRKIESKVKSAIYSYDLISSGDRVMVGLSGGKDSYALLDLLFSIQLSIPQKFEIEACHVQAIDMAYKADEDFMRSYCLDREIPLHFKQIEVDFKPENGKPACFICSWKRRKALFAIARERKCNKLAFGHHLDDAIETLLMNMIHHSSISSLPPIISMFGGDMDIIRPLINVHNDELTDYSKLMGFPTEKEKCPFDDTTNREEVRSLIKLAYKLNKSAGENIFRSMANIYHDYIVKTPKKKDLLDQI